MIGTSHILLAGALAACVAGIGGFAYGTRIGSAQEQVAQKRVDDAAEIVRRQLQDKLDASGEQDQATEYARQTNVREIYHESEKIIDRPVYRNICIDADGVRLLDRAAAVANGEGVGAPAGDAARPPKGPTQ